MRGWVIVAVIGVLGCSDREKDRQIAELQKRLEIIEKAKTRSTAATAGEGQQVEVPGADTPPPKPAPTELTPEDALKKRVVSGGITADDVVELLKQASDNKSITFAHLKKNADKYLWKAWRLRGRLFQTIERDGKTKGLVSLSDYAEQRLWFECECETDFVDGNIVEMVGLLTGDYSYKSTAGWDVTVPAISVAKIAKPGQLDGKKPRRVVEDD